jgi:general secretion pathway protein K
MISPLSNNRGVALVLVILMIGVIVAVTIQLNYSARSGIYEGANMRDAVRLTYVAKSGFYGGQALLNEDTNSYDSLNEEWAEADFLSAASGSFFNKGYFRLNIEDESGKIPVNKLISGNNYNSDIENLLLRFLALPEFDLTDQEVEDIVDSIKDWIDEDDEVTGFGAEAIYYESLEVPYECKNAPLDCVEELLMVKGISEKLFYGTDDLPGIGGYCSVYGEGKININTASKLVLRALSDEITEEMADSMDAYRRDEDNNLSRSTWYKDVSGMDAVTIDGGIITTTSDFFTITSTGYLGEMRKRLTGVVKRDKNSSLSKLLSWKVE